MNNVWKKPANTYESSAKVVDGNLIISMPDAVNPVVWRMELGSIKASALEVRSQGENGQYMLFLKTPKGDVHDIAPFADKELAVQALMRVSHALQGAHGKMSAAPAAVAAQEVPSSPAFGKTGGSGYKWLLALGGLFVVIILFAYLGSLTPATAPQGNMAGAQADKEAGIPQSADELLRGF